MNPRTDPEDEIRPAGGDYLEQDMEDDIYCDEFDGPDDHRALDFDVEVTPKYFTAKQRVEMFREEQWLRSLTADLDDFDRIDGIGDGYVAEFSL